MPLAPPILAAGAVVLRPARDADGTWEARKFQRDGAGMLSSLTETDGLVELEEDRIEVVPGDIVRFHPHEALW